MKRLLLTVLLTTAPAIAAPPTDFDARVEALRVKIGVPGMAVAIVENGQTVLARGYGVRRLGSAEKVDADTIFMTGSTGKAFTAAALATLVDAGKIGWDDKVTDRLPGFEMYDPWVTREITIRDLLVHRSGLGLGEGDLLAVPRTNIPRAEAVRRIRYLKPATSFRSGFAYDNVLYMVAGQLIEAVTGERWEDYVREHVLTPAGMTDTTTENVRRFAIPDRAYPNARTSEAVRGLGQLGPLDEHDALGDSAAPAGGLAISANDMAKWLTLQLAHGKLPNGDRLFSEASHDEMWKPEVLQPISPLPDSLKATQPMFDTYAFGWEVRDYHGAKIVWHEGAVLGFESIVVLLPEKKVGFAVEINSEDGEILLGLMYELLDHYMDLPPDDWPAKFSVYKQEKLVAAEKIITAKTAAPAGSVPSLPLERYAGVYTDSWYGKIKITNGANGLAVDFLSTPHMEGPLKHWQYDSFVTRFTDKTIEPAYLTFDLDADGHVSQIELKPVSPLADFSYDYQDLDFRPES